MKKSKVFLFVFPLLLVACGQSITGEVGTEKSATAQAQGLFDTIPVVKPAIVRRLPHANSGFTEGLEINNDMLYESTGLDNKSTLNKIDLTTGDMIQQRPIALSGAFGEGLTILNGNIYQLTYKNGKVLLYKQDTLEALKQLSYSGEGWGIANDGKQLIMSNGGSNLYWRDPETFSILHQVTVKAGLTLVNNLNELEYVNGQVYANIFLKNRIARIDASTGKVTEWIDITDLANEARTSAAKQGYTFNSNDVSNGIAYYEKTGTFYLTGKHWPMIFEVKVN